jgi:hypothetical protein
MNIQGPNILKTLLAVVLVLASTCFFPLRSQEPVVKNALSSSAGPSIPFSEFASRSFTPRAGFAKAGANLDLDIIRYGRRGIFGIYADLGLANIFFDEKSYIAEYERILNNEGTTTASTGSYQFLTVHGGFLIRFAEFLDTRIIMQAGIGYTLARHPCLSATNSYWGEINRVNSDLDLQIGSSASIKVERVLNEETGVHLAYSLFACKPDFRDTEGFREYTFYLPVRYQSINIGLTRYF